MYLCYVDESGTPDIPGNTSHYVLAGISIPVWHWRTCDNDIDTIKRKYGLESSEIHVAWILRTYREQNLVKNFGALDYRERRYEVEKIRNTELLRLQRSGNPKLYKQTRKNFRKTNDYIHLTIEERFSFILEIAQCVSNWGFARLFAECVDKVHFDPSRTSLSVDEQAFQQLVSRFEQYLRAIGAGQDRQGYGVIIHDNNETVARKHTEMMKRFLRQGTFWTDIENLVETPLFVDSQLTSMVQVADLCGYALRRYLENGEETLFNLIFKRADRRNDVVVGVRHFTNSSCSCRICQFHRREK